MYKKFLLGVGVAVIVAAGPTHDVFSDIAAQIKGPLKDLSVLDQEDKKLKQSNQDTVDFDIALKKQQTSNIFF